MQTRGTVSDLPLFAHVSTARPAVAIERDITAGRHGGAPTSRLAQLDRAGRASEQRARVFRAILDAGAAGLTVDELAARWDQPPNRISGRFTELKAAGLLIIADLRPTRAGSQAIAYAANNEGSQPRKPAGGVVGPSQKLGG